MIIGNRMLNEESFIMLPPMVVSHDHAYTGWSASIGPSLWNFLPPCLLLIISFNY